MRYGHLITILVRIRGLIFGKRLGAFAGRREKIHVNLFLLRNFLDETSFVCLQAVGGVVVQDVKFRWRIFLRLAQKDQM